MTMLDDRRLPDASSDTLSTLATAYQALQRQNVRVATMVADELQIGPTDLRAIMYTSWNDHLTPKQLAAFLQMTTGATTSLIDRITAAGLAAREPHPTDRRSQIISLTPAGRRGVHLVLDTYRSAFAEALQPHDVPGAAAIFNSIATSLAVVELTRG